MSKNDSSSTPSALAQNSTEKVEARNGREERFKRLESIELLAGGLAHDLNNLLAPLAMYPDMIREEISSTSEIRQDLDAIENVVSQAQKLVRDLAMIAQPSPRPGPKRLVLSSVVQEVAGSWQKKHAQIRICQRGNVDEEVFADIEGLSLVLSRLLEQACEVMANSGGDILVAVESMTLDQSRIGIEEIPAGHYGVLRIRDQGPSFASEDLERMFEPFFSLRKVRRPGNGLSLPFVHSMTKDMGGFLDAFSNSEGTETQLFFRACAHKN